jgi:hypothetical protein
MHPVLRIFGVSVIAISLVTWAVVKSDGTPPQIVKQENPLTTITETTQRTQASLLQKDTDGDGLLDWEEGLWKTDISNKDTDGDGTNDGDEVALGRNPSIAGPDDTIDIERHQNTPQFATESVELNQTDRFAREFFTHYLSQKQTTGIVSQEELVLETLESSYLSGGQKTYIPKNLRTTSSNSEETFHTYGNSLGTALIQSSPNNLENEIDIFDEAVRSGSLERLADLDPIIEGYSNFLQELEEMTIPDDALEFHINLLTAVFGIQAGLQDMRNVTEDSLTALIAINTYSDGVEFLRISFEDLIFFFIQNNVVFQQSESGFNFISSI